ncbi:hypothetical protein K3495_g3551 [Podosphaera aphanis]|nr:hypothetical protein K3495_g3551 [Podosphaera aphanis]
MEALSPRDANAHIRTKYVPKQELKPIALSKTRQKEKDHPPPPPAEVIEPPSFDRKNGAIYKTGNLLGRGGFAICYEGQHSSSKKKFALKIVKSHMPLKKMEQKFQTELQIHSKMKHSNIVEFHRAFSYQKCTYIVLELCPNGSLMDIVKTRKYVTEPEVRYWTVQMAGAIKYMHCKGIIHRDLKMGNIFLDENMDIKIGDFGLAALLMSGKDLQACRRTTLCGTPNYIAPEILSKDKGGHDHAVDIWSLGIIIFAMLTGKPPFQSATAEEIYRRARERDYDWPKLDTSENIISEETKNLVAELLQAPHQRPDPDHIVQHPFFNCGWTPKSEDMTPALREKHPDQIQFLTNSHRGRRTTNTNKNLRELCIQCDVGPWTSSKKHTSTYREVAEEEKLGLTPSVPLAENVVYHPFREWLEGQVKIFQKNGGNAENALDILEKVISPAPITKLSIDRSYARAPPLSFAAQQRTKAQGIRNPLRKIHETRSNADKSVDDHGNVCRKTSSGHKKIDINVENRLAADLAHQLKVSDVEPKTHNTNSPEPPLKNTASIFENDEKIQPLPNTRPEIILDRLRRLQAELERALRSRSPSAETRKHEGNPIIVVKWVDYTNKFGLGYILSNGSVGTIFRALPAYSQDPSMGFTPPSCVFIQDSEKHLVNQNNPEWIDFGQLVPISGSNIEFLENRGEKGLFIASVDPKTYKTIPGPNGELLKLGPGRDEFDCRKKERVSLWRKFGNYMTQYGRDTGYLYDEITNRTTDLKSSMGQVVTFYQRWGDVGCWGFGDGHLQFNFPDHTKIILSDDGVWCDFYHLPLEAARDLSEKGVLPAQALDDRQHLSYPLQTLLNFMPRSTRSRSQRLPEIDPMIQGIPQANDFRRKIEFIVLCIKEWTRNGGIGISDLSVDGRLRWSGARQTVNIKMPYKQVWVCVGGQSTDERKVMWFDPRKPSMILPDIQL